MTDSMHRNTPSLTVYDSRGLAVRQTDYYRAQVDADAQACVNAQVYDSQGRAVAVWDPRLFELRSAQPDLPPNFANVHSLSGAVLSSHSVDAGETLCLFAQSGAAIERWDARGTHWQTEHDEFMRPVAIHEQTPGLTQRTCERFMYAGSDAESASRNQCGQRVRIDDSAGTQAISAYSLTGGVLMEERRMLRSIQLPDWPSAVDERDPLLEPDTGATTHRRFDASGTPFSTTDARGNLQIMTLNVAGQLAGITLTLMGAEPQVLLRDVHYNACEQIESQTAGNGVSSHCRYHEGDGRLLTLQTTRAANDPVQLLAYGYDPVGNVTSITDDAQAVRHFANQRIEPANRYTYDSFYQLIEARGRETAAVSNGPQLPDMQPLPIDSNQWLNFTERYRYDSAGNLIQLRHEGSQPYTRDFEIDQTSNRSLIKPQGSAPPDIANAFDPCGNLQQLSPGQLLAWDGRNRLLKITPVSRRDANDDAEQYAYDSSGQRVRKIAMASARAATHSREVRYLPSLELRRDSATDVQLEVIVIQAGRCAVRCLHWLSGRPADIENDQLRYSIDDHLGSSALELDGKARLISHEGYYPFGGTAWWAAQSVIEAKYKVVRYSGKERDASGLYYYGLRYYAPWLMRWVSADPGGAVDGLNLYRMVRNNPISFVDHNGAQSNPLTEWPVLAAILLGFIIGIYIPRLRALHAAANQALDDASRVDAELAQERQTVLQQFRDEHGLRDDEIEPIENFLNESSTPSAVEVGWVSNVPYAFDLAAPGGRGFFQRHRLNFSPRHLDKAANYGIRYVQLGSAPTPPENQNASTDLPVVTPAASALPASAIALPVQIGTAEVTRRNRSKKTNARSAPQPASPPATKTESGPRFPQNAVEGVEAFLENSPWNNGQGIAASRRVIRDVVAAFSGENRGNPHPLSDGTLSLDLPTAQQGRGAERLILQRQRNGRWKPLRIGDTHAR